MVAIHCETCHKDVLLGYRQLRVVNDPDGITVHYRCWSHHSGTVRPTTAL